MFQRGDTFYGGEEVHGKDHLWVVINDPAQHEGTALYVNITTLKGSFAELTCVLQRGEHPFIEHASHVRFDGAKSALVTELEEAERLRLIVRQEKASEQLVNKIRQAAIVSPRLNRELKNLL